MQFDLLLLYSGILGEQNETSKSMQNPSQQEGDKFVASSTLVYIGKEKDHNKIIYCQATNFFGNLGVKSITKILHIQHGPKLITLVPSVTVYTVKDTDSIKINCSTICVPECLYYWTGPGESLTNAFGLNLDSINRNQSGIYFCHVSNLHGNKTSSGIKIEVIGQSVANTFVFAFCKTTSAIVQWKIGFNGGLSQQFSIKYWHLDGMSYMSQNLSDTGIDSFMQLNINGLLPSTEYLFSVTAYNTFWNSSSKIVSCKTDPQDNCAAGNQEAPGLFAAGISSLVLVLLAAVSTAAALVVCQRIQNLQHEISKTHTKQ